MPDYRNAIRQCARTDQYMLHPRALQRLSDFVTDTSYDDAMAHKLIRDLFNLLKKEQSQDRFVDETRMNRAIQNQLTVIRGLVERDTAAQVSVVPLNSIPRATIDEISGDIKAGPPTAPGSEDRLRALRERYLLARRRCLRSGIYRADMKKRIGQETLLPLIPTTALEGLPPSVTIAVLGLLVVRDGRVELEDIHSHVSLKPRKDLALSKSFFVGAGLLVVAVGHWENGALLVSRLDLPPAERRESTLAEVGAGADLFGLAPTDAVTALSAERNALRSVIVFLSHVHLDRPSTMSHLAYFFQRMQERSEGELTDTTFVLTGNFSSLPLTYGDASHLPGVLDGGDTLPTLFEKLGTCVAANAPTAAQHSHFILVPGPHDLSALQGVVPQAPIASHFAKELRAKLKHVTLAPNPCRLRFYTHEVIVARRDFLRQLQETERNFPWHVATVSSPQVGDEEGEGKGEALASFERIAKTVVDEAHLSPCELNTTLWKLDSALRLTALPHTLLLCDSTEQWECSYKGVHVVNPGSFAVNSTFLWYTPADGECSLSSLD